MILARRVAAAAVVLLAVGCINTTAPTGFAFRYQVRAFRCGTTCTTPDSTTQIASAARGDTVWVQHRVDLIAALDSLAPQSATLRPDCAGSVAVVNGSTTVRTLPTPTCADSTYRQAFQLADVDYPRTIVIYTRWVVDPALTPAQYGLRGRVVFRPLLEPVSTFDVQ